MNRNALLPRSWVLVAPVALVFLASSARAHFLWLDASPEAEGVVVRGFLSEQPAPDQPKFLKFIEDARYSAGDRPLEATRGEDAFRIELPEPSPWAIDGVCPLGLMSRDGQTFRLFYTARAQLEPAPADAPKDQDHLRMRLVRDDQDTPVVQVTFQGKPAAGATVKAYLEHGQDRELTTDDDGRVTCPGVAEGRTALLAKWGDGKAGELDGKPFDETRFYATLTVALPEARVRLAASTDQAASTDHAASTDKDAPEAPRNVATLTPLPEAINSFGGAVADGWLYVYGGHTGTTHRYHSATTSPHFRRLKLEDGATWEELPGGPAVQGVALVAHDGTLYRVGGMEAHNAEGKPNDLVSIAEVARFDPATKAWKDLPPLPEPRSTHDAIVIGDHLYVVGGWALLGGEATNSFFHEDALRLDLTNPDAGWEPLSSPPFRRRALAAATLDGKLYVLGGLTEDSGTVREVDIYDPATRTWSKGPELPGTTIVGFGPSAFGVDGRLYASGGDGNVQRLSEDGKAWEQVGRLAVPRITHRLLPGRDGELLAVGGNFAGSPVRFVERFRPDEGGDGPVMLNGSLPIGTDAVKSQAIAWNGSGLIVAGGSGTWQPHAFEPHYLSAEVVRVSIGTLGAPEAAPLPSPRQSGTLVTVPAGGHRGVSYLLGGIAQDGGAVRTVGSVLRLDPESDAWDESKAAIPDDRGMFGAAVDGANVWVFGGDIFDPRDDSDHREFPTEVLRWVSDRDGATFEDTGQRLPRPRRSFAGAVLDRTYYLVGGIDGNTELVDTVDVFDFASKSWGTIPAPSRPRIFADLVVLDGALYLAGGFSRGEAEHFEPNRGVERFDPESGTWATVIDEVPLPSTDTRMIAVGGRLLFFGIDPKADGQARFALIAP